MFEKKFKELDLKKNLTQDQWKYIIRKKRKREDSHQAYEVTALGQLIPHKKIQKEESRFTLGELDIIRYYGISNTLYGSFLVQDY